MRKKGNFDQNEKGIEKGCEKEKKWGNQKGEANGREGKGRLRKEGKEKED